MAEHTSTIGNQSNQRAKVAWPIINSEAIELAKRMYASGARMSDMAHAAGMSLDQVKYLVNRHRWQRDRLASLPGEEWRPIPGADHAYLISNFGRGQRPNGLPLKSYPQYKGYVVYSIVANGRSRLRTVHSLVCLCFVGPRPDGYQINHKDGNKTNNHVSNLEYVTPLENNRHAMRMGLSRFVSGSKIANSFFTEEQVVSIRHRLANGAGVRAIADEFGVRRTTIQRIRSRKCWKDVP